MADMVEADTLCALWAHCSWQWLRPRMPQAVLNALHFFPFCGNTYNGNRRRRSDARESRVDREKNAKKQKNPKQKRQPWQLPLPIQRSKTGNSFDFTIIVRWQPFESALALMPSIVLITTKTNQSISFSPLRRTPDSIFRSTLGLVSSLTFRQRKRNSFSW